MSGSKNETIVRGVITEALPSTLFRAKIEENSDEKKPARNAAHSVARPHHSQQRVGQAGGEILAYLSGKMRMHRIKVLIGDEVEIVLDPYGGKGRIVKRL